MSYYGHWQFLLTWLKIILRPGSNMLQSGFDTHINKALYNSHNMIIKCTRRFDSSGILIDWQSTFHTHTWCGYLFQPITYFYLYNNKKERKSNTTIKHCTGIRIDIGISDNDWRQFIVLTIIIIQSNTAPVYVLISVSVSILISILVLTITIGQIYRSKRIIIIGSSSSDFCL